jgi:hypothetical protein
MVPCPSCGTEMREAFKGETLVYYVCGNCGVSKMDVEPAAIPPMSDPQPKQTGLVCVRCNQPYAVIENEGPDKFILHCQRCDHRWTVPTSDRKPVSDIH